MNFGKDLGRFQVDAIGATEKTVRGTAIALWKAVILDSPVDSGRFRGNWFASSTTPETKVTTNIDKAGAVSVSRATTEVLTASDWENMWLANNLPYSERLEFGWSNQAPSGVVRTNVIRFQGILAEEARKN